MAGRGKAVHLCGGDSRDELLTASKESDRLSMLLPIVYVKKRANPGITLLAKFFDAGDVQANGFQIVEVARYLPIKISKDYLKGNLWVESHLTS